MLPIQFKVGDTVIAVSQGAEQTPPLKIVDLQYRGDEIYYKLDESSPTFWPEVIPGDGLTWALVHLRLGWSVIPVEPQGKRPPVSGYKPGNGEEIRYAWKKYQAERARESTLQSWWDRWPGMNHAIVCGSISGIVVLDIDGPEGERYAKDQGLPETPTATSGKGMHVYFRHPGHEVKNMVRKVTELDLKGDGGYIIAAGSFHGERQKTYRWIKAPWDVPLADMPDWLVDLTQEAEREPVATGELANNEAYAQAALENELGKMALATEGNRNNQLNQSAFSLGQLVSAGALNEADVMRSLLSVARAAGLSDSEAQATIHSGIEAGKQEPRRIPEAPTVLPPFPDATTDDIATEIAEWRKKQEKCFLKNQESPDFFEEAKELMAKAAALSEAQVDEILDELEKEPNPLVYRKRTQLKRLWKETNKGAQILQAATAQSRKPTTWPYQVKNGRIHYLSERTFQEAVTIQSTPVADFEAQISEQITDEGGERTFKIVGVAVRGGPFNFTIDAEDFGNDRLLKAKTDAASGGRDPVRAGMAKHLGPAIKLLTTDEMVEIKRYSRTGWSRQGFLIPGLEKQGVVITLPRKLPYSIDKNADLTLGLKALEALIECIEPARTTVLISAILQAPMIRLIDGWSNERYGIFVSGRTGSFKTSICQVAMSIYGPNFMADELLVKWGEGATSNAMMGMAVHASDMPFLIDNFKPNTGGGVSSFIGLVHNIVEGGEKDRLNRAAELRDTRPIYCLPICTGEDVPESDAASLARILTIPFKWQRGEPNPKLTLAQELSGHISAVGAAWLCWLESEEGKKVAGEIGAQFNERRACWMEELKYMNSDSVNVQRVASNLATNELTWQIIKQHPTIGCLAETFEVEHAWGLSKIVATEMARSTSDSLEAQKYLNALRELLTTGTAILLQRNPSTPFEDEPTYAKDRQIGWEDEDGIYLLPATARRMIDRLMPDGMNGVSSATIYKQLDEMGLIKASDKNTNLKVVWIDGKSQKVLFLDRKAISGDDLPE